MDEAGTAEDISNVSFLDLVVTAVTGFEEMISSASAGISAKETAGGYRGRFKGCAVILARAAECGAQGRNESRDAHDYDYRHCGPSD